MQNKITFRQIKDLIGRVDEPPLGQLGLDGGLLDEVDERLLPERLPDPTTKDFDEDRRVGGVVAFQNDVQEEDVG